MPVAQESAEAAGLLEAIGHVDSLNSWIRLESFRAQWPPSQLARVLYYFKGHALQEAMSGGLTEHYKVVDIVTCRDCGGDGRYMDSYGYTHDHCWKCSNKGNVSLWFLRTRIDGGRYVWHTPREKAWGLMSSERFEALPRDFCGEWHVNQPGRDLDLDDAVVSLMALEERWPLPRRPADGRYGLYWDDVDRTAQYRLCIGRTADDRCVLCDAPEHYIWLGIAQGRLRWSASVCKCCYMQRDSQKIHERCAECGPGELLTQTIRKWAETHAVAQRFFHD